MTGLADRACHRAIWTIGVFCSIQLFLNFLDRSNISFAALQMNADLGMSPKSYGLAVSVYFAGQLLFSLPVAMMASRFGLRPVLAIIVVAWGTVTSLMSMVNSALSLTILRFFLGAAEAGTASIVTLVLAQWIPRRVFGRAMMLVQLAMPFGQIVAGPMSGYLMTHMNGVAGLQGWRWLFGIESVVTIFFGIFTWFWLRDSPRRATWLPQDEKEWLIDELARDAEIAAAESANRARSSLRDLIADPMIWIFGLINFCILASIYMFMFWLPQILRDASVEASLFTVTARSALPWVGMVIGMLIFGLSSDRARERTFHLLAALLATSIGFAIAVLFDDALQLAGITLAVLGLGGTSTIFWTMPPEYMSGSRGAAPAFAIISIIGTVGGIVTPNVIGWLRSVSDGFGSTLILMICVQGCCALLILEQARRRRSREKTSRSSR